VMLHTPQSGLIYQVQATIRHGQSKIEASLFTRSKYIQEDTQLKLELKMFYRT